MFSAVGHSSLELAHPHYSLQEAQSQNSTLVLKIDSAAQPHNDSSEEESEKESEKESDEEVGGMR